VYYNSAANEAGLYTVRVSVDGFIENEIKTFNVSIGVEDYSGSVSLSVGSGKSISGNVTMTYDARRLSYAKAVIRVYKDNALIDTKDSNTETLSGLMTMSEAGNYEVIIVDSSDAVIFADSFTITSAASTTVWIILGIAAVVGLIITFVFMRLRKNMRVK
jgi:archaellum biogenesis ATPase FlaH